MIIIFIILYSAVLGFVFGFFNWNGVRWFHILVLNLLIAAVVTCVIAELERDQLSDAPMYLVGFIVMVAMSTVISLVVYDLSKKYFESK